MGNVCSHCCPSWCNDIPQGNGRTQSPITIQEPLKNNFHAPQLDTSKEAYQESTRNTFDDINLDALGARISSILDSAKAKTYNENSVSGKWNLTNSSSLSKLQDVLSQAGQCGQDVKKMLSIDHGGEVFKVVKGFLDGLAKVHWVTAGLLVVGFVLDRYETISLNKEECLDLLDEMFRLCNYLKDIKQVEALKEQMGDLLPKSIELIMESAIMCTSQTESSWFTKFWTASKNKDKLQELRSNLDKMHTHILLKACIYNAQIGSRVGIRVAKESLYPSHAVGITPLVTQVTEMLELDSKKRALAVILHGFGGTGKTTLADAVYATIDRHDFKFSNVCLFKTIKSEPNIPEIQKQIIDDLSDFKDQYQEPSTASAGQAILSKLVEQKQCFIYIDNVLSSDELKKLLPKNLRRSRKLRLMLTARDLNVQDVVNVGRADNVKVFEVPCLDRENSIALLGNFMDLDEEDPKMSLDSEQLNYILKVCGGLPLALEIVGGYLANQKNKKMACGIIKQEFQRSGGETLATKNVDFFAFAFDDLPAEPQQVFLDICAFSVKEEWSFIQRIYGEDVVQLLERRALIKKQGVLYSEVVTVQYEEDATIGMHDIILEMGRKRCQGNRIRTVKELKGLLLPFENRCDKQDIFADIKGIFLQETKSSVEEAMAGKSRITVDAEVLDHISSSLRIFVAHTQTENERGGKMQTVLETKGNCKAVFHNLILWETPLGEVPFPIEASPKLRSLDYSPTNPVDLSQLPSCLRSLFLRLNRVANGSSPIHVPEGIGSCLPALQELGITDSPYLSNIPAKLLSFLRALKEIWIENCPALSELPDVIHLLPSLKCLIIHHMASLKTLPENLGSCASLTELHLTDCGAFESLPKNMNNLTTLERLSLKECQGIKELPADLGKCESLKSIEVVNCLEVQELPADICQLSQLQALTSSGSRRLQRLPFNFGKLSSLKFLDVSGCCNLRHLSEDFKDLSSLKELHLEDCSQLDKKWIEVLIQMNSLKEVYIKGCNQLIAKVEDRSTKVRSKIKYIY